MKIGRRGFLQVVGVGAGTCAAGAAVASSAAGAHAAPASSDAPGMLVDTTLCVGCRGCEAACAEANGNPPPPDGDDVLAKRRDTTENAFTVVNRVDGVESRFAKKQCMHCISPACASACPVRAMDKKPDGPVTYDPSACLGCRYCMVACPFDVPKYEYNSNAPRVRKCSFCATRQQAGLKPACAEVCPSGALTFGRRDELLELAKTRIYTNPTRYVHHIFGEHEAGGTSWLYIGDFQLEKMALRNGVPEKEVPSLVAGALGAPPFVMTLWPPLLMGIYMFSKKREGENGHEAHDGKEDHHG